MHRPETVASLGVSRSGKTSLLYLLIERLLGDQKAENILFIKADDDRVEKKGLVDDAMESHQSKRTSVKNNDFD